MLAMCGWCFNIILTSRVTAFIVVSVVTASYVLHCDGAESTDCTPRAHLPCTVVKPFPYCTESDISKKYQGSAGTPTIEDLTPIVTAGKTNDTSKYLYPGLNISWTGPDDDSLKSIKGFYLSLFVLNGHDMGKRLCRVFNLTTAQWNQADTANPPIFHHTIETIWYKSDYTMMVTIYSLPSPKWKNDSATIQILGAREKSGDPPSVNWKTYIVLRTSPNTVDVSFGLAKSKFGFRTYEVAVANFDRGTYVKEPYLVNAPANGHIFTDICPGTYYVWVRPHNPDPSNKNGNSVCFRDVHKTLSERFCTWSEANVNITGSENCKSARAPSIVPSIVPSSTLSPGPPVKVNLLEDPGTSIGSPIMFDSKTVVGIVVGVGSSLILLVTMGLIYLKCYRRGLTLGGDTCKKKKESKNITVIDPFCLNNDDQSQTNPLEVIKRNKKRVMLVYSKDNPAHCKVVLCLANFLQTWCYCDVILDIWSEDQLRNKPKTEWLKQNLDLRVVHRIIIINSEGSYSMYQAARKNLFYEKMEKDSQPIGDIFLPAIDIILTNQEQVYDRYIMLHLDYTHESHCLPYISTGLKYRLPDHLEDLFFHIHGINKHGPGNENIIKNINCRDFCLMGREGELFYKAINEVRTFVQDDPKWFYNLYNEPVARLTFDTTGVPLSDDHVDSGIDSEMMPSSDLYTSVPSSPTFYPPIELQHDHPGDMIGLERFPTVSPICIPDMMVPPDVCILPPCDRIVQPELIDRLSTFTKIITGLNSDDTDTIGEDPTVTSIYPDEPIAPVSYHNSCYKNDLDDTISDGGISI